MHRRSTIHIKNCKYRLKILKYIFFLQKQTKRKRKKKYF